MPKRDVLVKKYTTKNAEKRKVFIRLVFVRQMSQKYNGMSIIMVILLTKTKRESSWSVYDSFFIDDFADTFIEGV